MKNIFTKILSAAFISVVMMSVNVFAANPASFTLSPSSNNVTNGSTFNVAISENGDSVTVVTLKLAFDSSKLQLMGATCGGSLPGTIAETNGVTCYVLGGSPISGNVTAANVSFKALTGDGATILSIASNSKIATNSVNIWDQVASTTTINLTTPAPTPTPTPTPASVTTNTTNATKSNTASAVTSPITSTSKVVADNTTTTPAASKGSTLGALSVGTSKKGSLTAKLASKKNSDDNWVTILFLVVISVAFIYFVSYSCSPVLSKALSNRFGKSSPVKPPKK